MSVMSLWGLMSYKKPVLWVTCFAVFSVLTGILLEILVDAEFIESFSIVPKYLVLIGLLLASFILIFFGISSFKNNFSRKQIALCFITGLSIAFVHGFGSFDKYRTLNSYLNSEISEAKNVENKLEKSNLGFDETCEYSLSIAKKMYYFKGDLLTYKDCNNVNKDFQPNKDDTIQRNKVIEMQSTSDFSRISSVFWILTVLLSVVVGFLMPISKPK